MQFFFLCGNDPKYFGPRFDFKSQFLSEKCLELCEFSDCHIKLSHIYRKQ